jgi:hypothetical protein
MQYFFIAALQEAYLSSDMSVHGKLLNIIMLA